MADEQIILLSQEEELTSVRERLEKAQARRIKLVLPMQTQMRSLVSWRLLHSRARELGKEILVISPESQIRAVAKAAGFQVAESQGSPATGKSRPGSRPGRAGLGGKTSARLRTPPGRGEARQPDQRQRPSQPYNDQPTTQKPVDDRISREDQLSTGGATSPLSSSTFGGNEKPYGPEYDYSIGSSPSMRSLGSPYEDDEPDLYLEDIQKAKRIREAAQESELDTAGATAPSDQMVPPADTPRRYNLPSTPDDPDDPFTYMMDDQPASLPEQRGSVSFHDIAEDPTDVLSIEDLGDDDDTFHRPDASSQAWAGPDGEQDMPGPSRVHGVHPRTSRMSRSLPQSPPPGSEDEVALPPVYDQPTRVSPFTTSSRPSGSLSSSALGGPNRPPQAVSLPQPRSTQPGTTQPQKKQRPGKSGTPGTSGKGSTGAIPARATPKAATPQAKRPGKMQVGNIGIPILVGMLILLLLGLLAYLGPSADVTVTLPSHDYKLQLSLTASATSRQDVKLNTLPAHVLTFNASATGTGHATGSTTVGTVQARGTVFFNNTGSSNIVVPTGTSVATKDNVQFLTQAEVLALPGNNNPPTFVQAVIAGVSGNVAANSISVIPPDSQAKILQANSGLTAPLALSVTNTDPTTGGAGSATSVSNDDVNREKAALDPQLQAQVQHFMTKNVGPNDQLGKMMQTETPVSTPAAGNVVVNGNFTETVTLHLTVLVVRAADLQAAAKAQLNTVLDKQKTGLALVPQQVVQLTQIKNTPSKDGTSLALNLLATGQAAPQVSENTVRSLVTGKSIDDATHAIIGPGGIPHALNTQIAISPSFFGWVPFYSPRIAVHFKAIKTK